MANFVDIEMARRELTKSRKQIRRSFGSGPNWEARKDLPVTVGECCRTASIDPKAGQYLYNLVRRLQPVGCIELGTCLGISAFYMALALDHMNQGHLYSVEGEKVRWEIAEVWQRKLRLRRLSLINALFEDALPTLLDGGPFNFAFVDGSHTYEKTLLYFEMLVEHPNFKGNIIFDDKDRPGVAEALVEIRQDPRVKRVVQTPIKRFERILVNE